MWKATFKVTLDIDGDDFITAQRIAENAISRALRRVTNPQREDPGIKRVTEVKGTYTS